MARPGLRSTGPLLLPCVRDDPRQPDLTFCTVLPQDPQGDPGVADVSAPSPSPSPECLFLQELHPVVSAGAQGLVWASEEAGRVSKS